MSNHQELKPTYNVKNPSKKFTDSGSGSFRFHRTLLLRGAGVGGGCVCVSEWTIYVCVYIRNLFHTKTLPDDTFSLSSF